MNLDCVICDFMLLIESVIRQLILRENRTSHRPPALQRYSDSTVVVILSQQMIE